MVHRTVCPLYIWESLFHWTWIKTRILKNQPKQLLPSAEVSTQDGREACVSCQLPKGRASPISHLPLDGFLLARANAKAVLTVHQDIFWTLSWISCGNFTDEGTGPISIVTVPKAHLHAVRTRTQTWVPAWLPQLGSYPMAYTASPACGNWFFSAERQTGALKMLVSWWKDARCIGSWVLYH